MMNRQEALDFAKACAGMARDMRNEYSDSIASFRENLRDTLADERAAQFEVEAFEIYDAEIARLFKR